MFQRINYFLIRRCYHYVRYQRKNKKLLRDIFTNIFVGGTHLFVGTKVCCAVLTPTIQEKMDVENVQKALHEGDIAVLNLMEELKDLVKVISVEYRNCLQKQIEITEKCQGAGPLSDIWDEIPQYRTLADELLQELNNYKALFEMLGEMAEAKFSVNFDRDSNIVSNVIEKFKVLRQVIDNEFEENKHLELKLLKLNCDTILMDVLIDNDQQ